MTPEIFAPGVISFGYHEHRMAISPDDQEIYYTVFAAEGRRAMIMYSGIKNGNLDSPGRCGIFRFRHEPTPRIFSRWETYLLYLYPPLEYR